MAQARWTATTSDDEVRFDLEPSGFVGHHREVLLWMLVIGVISVPMGLFGLFAGVMWRDFGISLRLFLGCVGAIAVVVPLAITVKACVDATSLRARVRVRPGGVFVERGVRTPRRALWLAPLADVVMEHKRGLRLSRGAAKLDIAVGHAAGDALGLLAAMQEAQRSFVGRAGSSSPPPSQPLGLAWSQRLRGLGRDLVRPLRTPRPFVLLDLGAILGTQLLVWWTVSADRSAMYPTAYVLYLLGLAARSFDRSYLNGLRRYLDDRSEHVAFYMLAAVALSLPGVTGLAPWFGFWGGFAAALLANLGLHAWLKQRARAEPPRSSHRALDLALAATLVPICALHEVTIYDILVDTAGDLGPFALSFVPVFVLLGYWPLRLHAFVDEPEDRSSVLWFWLTVGWLTAQPLIVFGGQIARMR